MLLLMVWVDLQEPVTYRFSPSKQRARKGEGRRDFNMIKGVDKRPRTSPRSQLKLNLHLPIALWKYNKQHMWLVEKFLGGQAMKSLSTFSFKEGLTLILFLPAPPFSSKSFSSAFLSWAWGFSFATHMYTVNLVRVWFNFGVNLKHSCFLFLVPFPPPHQFPP